MLSQPFDRDSLVALRATVAAHADGMGLRADRLTDLVLAAHELATNAVRHGGGAGRLRMWVEDGELVCEVADSGDGFAFEPDDMRVYPPLGATGGRGLWIVARLATRFDVTTGADGTVARFSLPLT
ncbi:ATP-binding protein [Virgisporangium aliadipatigenens]|uniref:ATP-binding protein n=1 Tax=Virgisporangium aliadipatigenens TaxID=741659 RepID=UPI001945B1AB|nr:ATP-binding protein [Virgisporangium aliadipatigenens]